LRVSKAIRDLSRMLGLAKQRFQEMTKTALVETEKTSFWPMLDKAVHLGCISFVELALAQFLLKKANETNELAAAFLCHLFRAVREGHLCVKKVNGLLHPLPKTLWFSDIPENQERELAAFLHRLSQEDVILPPSLVTDVAIHENPSTPVCRIENRYYFQKFWQFEASLLLRLKELILQKPEIEIGSEDTKTKLKSLQANQWLNPLQAAAIFNATQNRLSIICGGPGTGKTYTAGHLIRIFWESLNDEQKSHDAIILAAPTGKAANALQKSLEEACRELNAPISLKAQTIHSCLRIRPGKNKRGPQTKVNADLVLVDESSMIDVELFSYLLDSLKTGSRLVLIGDPYQLPPVETGAVFKDLIEQFKGKYSVELQTCVRAENKELVTFSHFIKEADAKSALKQMRSNQNVVKLVESQSKEALAGYFTPFIHNKKLSSPEAIITDFNRFRILSPLKKGAFGVEEINQWIHRQRFCQVAWKQFFASPIMITANDYKLNLFNGECGVLLCQKSNKPFFQKGDYAVFSTGKGEQIRTIPALLLPKFDYAYCISVHKSQGSEFDHVLLLLPEGSEKFGREVLYTAATRAKKSLNIWASEDVFQRTVANQAERVSGFASMAFD